MIPQHDEVLGELTYNERVNWLECHVAHGSDAVRIQLSLDACDDMDGLLAIARKVHAELSTSALEAKRYAASRLLALKNGAWLDGDEAPLDAETFMSRMRLESVTVYPSGAVTFWHDDGDLFWGHSVTIVRDEKGVFNDAEIEG